MTLLRGYVMAAVFKGVALVLLVLITVRGCIELVGQLNDVGEGSYHLVTALRYVLMRLPRAVFDTLPAASLIGSLLGLGNLAVHRELVVMRASGVSTWQLLSAVGLAGFGLAVLMALLGESLAPSLAAYAAEMRTRAVHEDVAVGDGQATWVKDGDRILSLRRQTTGPLTYGGGVWLFELGPDKALKRVARADSADIDANNNWVLANYAETSFADTGIESRRERESTETYGLNQDLLGLSVVRQDMLDTPALQRYIGYLRANNLDARRYEIAYWKRLADIVSVVLMTVLALPFVFGGLRSAGTGARLLLGLVIGLCYYVLGQLLASGGEVYGIDPRIVGWAPSGVLLLVTAVALTRAR
ncbi:MAG TPA: LPS export ABC transporter permease LptG [Gammaproteobacteria bacterium]|nr:LPS export ABC transporter permease LptG [Gammaproteobacteria bacterium]